ncbi:MAG TPA: hypothetical protein VL307_18475, partial [Chitinophagaceae bacterium]|nr:hypothetical protein [Chitinophagaceae bacterium]
KPLRKIHLQVWTALAILLPAGILLAWLSVPAWPLQAGLQPPPVTPLPVVLKKASNKNYTASIRTNSDGSALQLEWINKQPLQYPSAVIYAGPGVENVGRRLIGRVAERGHWYFPLDSSFGKNPGATQAFILYDFIHQQVIDSINCIP